MTTLNYHRYHGVHCEGSHRHKTFTTEGEERKKGWKRCQCPIVASGSLHHIHKRMATKQTDWREAEQMMAPYIAAGNWDIVPPPPAPNPTAPATPVPDNRMSVKDASEKYLEAHKQAKTKDGTMRNKKLRMRTLLDFTVKTGAVYMDQWNWPLVNNYLNQFAVQHGTRDSYHRSISAFFNFSQSEGWGIDFNPAKAPIKIHNQNTKNLAKGKPRIPFENPCLERMYEGCKKYDEYVLTRQGKLVPRTEPNRRTWNGDDLLDFILISVYTGLRISDVAMFNISRLRGKNEVLVRATKNDELVYTVVPMWLADRIRARAQKFGPQIFGRHESTRIDVITNTWRKRLIDVWTLCGQWDVKPTPHRFRHTFIRILLEKGRTYAFVADLVGDTEEVVRKHYSHWSPERQQLVSQTLEECFRDVPPPFPTGPRPKVVELKRKLG